MSNLQPTEFKQLIAQLAIELNPAEFHGFLSGLIAGGIQDESWKTLTYQFTNDGIALAESIADWTSQFILGLGLAQPKLNEETDEVGEAIDDLEEISKLGYHEDDSNEELLEAGEEVVEYLRVLSLFLHSHFALNATEKPTNIH